ncbi:hypothetical protein LTR08_008700 [Meristemomyces frigidus]|nr:hypothetical protein LTR08_008700 [Meristemomyces frigidus]
MSLAGSLKQFQSERADAVSRNIQHARPTTTAPSRTSTPKPPPASAPAAPDKRSHDAAFAPALAAKNEGVGREVMSHVVFTINFLHSHSPATLPWSRITSWLSLPQDLRRNLPFIKRALQTNDRARYVSAAESGTGQEGFVYRPLHPVTNGEELRGYLATLDTARGVSVKELKDGWPECAATIDLLESRGQILVARNKKDNAARLVWGDNASFHPPSNTNTNSTHHPTDAVGKVDPDFVDFWCKIKLPPNDNDIRAELERAGLTPTSAVKEAKKIEAKKGRKRAEKKNAKKTNVHMAGILKDYSGRKAGK